MSSQSSEKDYLLSRVSILENGRFIDAREIARLKSRVAAQEQEVKLWKQTAHKNYESLQRYRKMQQVSIFFALIILIIAGVM